MLGVGDLLLSWAGFVRSSFVPAVVNGLRVVGGLSVGCLGLLGLGVVVVVSLFESMRIVILVSLHVCDPSS